MAHKTSGTFSLSRIPADQREEFVSKLEGAKVETQYDEDARTVTITGRTEDFDVARALYNQKLAEVNREKEGEQGDDPDLAKQVEKAQERAEKAGEQSEGTLLQNPPVARGAESLSDQKSESDPVYTEGHAPQPDGTQPPADANTGQPLSGA